MKSFFFKSLFVTIALCLTVNLWFCHKASVWIYTNAPKNTEIKLTYRKVPNGKAHILANKTTDNGRVLFRVKGRYVSWFKIDVPVGVVVQKAEFRGREKKKFSLNNNEYNGEKLCGRMRIDLFKILTIGVTVFLSITGALNALKRRKQPDIPEKMPRMLNLEFLRIIFTFAVVWFHLVYCFKIKNSGWLGVEFFFILSGFLLVLTFKPEKTFPDFIKNKWIRFMPLTVFGGALNLIFEPDIRSIRVFADLFYFARTGIANEMGYNQPAWYISALMVVSGFYFYMMKTLKRETANLLTGVIVFFS